MAYPDFKCRRFENVRSKFSIRGFHTPKINCSAGDQKFKFLQYLQTFKNCGYSFQRNVFAAPCLTALSCPASSFGSPLNSNCSGLEGATLPTTRRQFYVSARWCRPWLGCLQATPEEAKCFVPGVSSTAPTPSSRTPTLSSVN